MSDKPTSARPPVAAPLGPTPQDEAMHAVDAHEGPIKTPKQLIATVVASFVIPIMVIILLVNFVNMGPRDGTGSDMLAAESVAQRLQPVGHVEVRDASGPQILHTGEQVFKGQCAACHANGVAGAPKVGDSAAWGPRVKQGYEALWQSALKGKGAMGPQAGGEYNDLEVGRAVVYMANQGGASFPVPQPPAGAASGAEAAASEAAATTAAAPASTPK